MLSVGQVEEWRKKLLLKRILQKLFLGGTLGLSACYWLGLVVRVEADCLDWYGKEGTWCFLPKLKTSDCHWKLIQRWRDDLWIFCDNRGGSRTQPWLWWRMFFSLLSHKHTGVPFYLIKRVRGDLICLFIDVQLLPALLHSATLEKTTFLANYPHKASCHILRAFNLSVHCIINIEQQLK